MSASAFLPLIPQPPHDPTSLLLNGRVGWRAKLDPKFLMQSGLELSLTLALTSESQRTLTEASGSFGGLTVPGNVAVGPDGGIYLLDTQHAQLKRFDPCSCQFVTIPCFGGVGSAPRQLRNPHGISICSGNLFVCDTDNQRISVFSLHGFVLRGQWRPPASSPLAKTWKPYALTFDQHGRLYVTDSGNSGIHRFSPAGQWETCFTGFGSVTWITSDCRDRLYVVVAGDPPSVRIVNPDGKSAPVASSVDELSPLFPRLPFVVDAKGLLHLGPLCAPADKPTCREAQSPRKRPSTQATESGVFDLSGNLVSNVSPTTVQYVTKGEYYSVGLDSELYRCRWHRVILRGEIPAGARVMVSTYAAEAELTEEQVRNLGDAWETNLTASEMQKSEWDCLIRSGGGRYLWLKLELRGNGKVTPRIDSVEVEFPRVSLRRYLPAVFGEEPVSADFTDRFLGLFDTTLRSVEKTLDQQARYFDPLSTPAERDRKTGADFLSWLASWIGLILDRHWPEVKRRQFLKQASRLYDLRGTRGGLWRELVLFLGLDEKGCGDGEQPRDRCRPAPRNCAPVLPPTCTWQPPPLILEHFKLRRWLFLGAGRIGDQAVLWGKRIVNRSQLDETAQVDRTQLLTTQDPLRDPFHVYAHKFTVFVPASCRASDASRKALENLLRSAQPAATRAHIEYVEPRFRIGFQSTIGFDSVVARYPAGVTLNETPLGRSSVLTEPPHKQGGPSLEIGKQARIGATTKLQ
jgi:phage tail-like protein